MWPAGPGTQRGRRTFDPVSRRVAAGRLAASAGRGPSVDVARWAASAVGGTLPRVLLTAYQRCIALGRGPTGWTSDPARRLLRKDSARWPPSAVRSPTPCALPRSRHG